MANRAPARWRDIPPDRLRHMHAKTTKRQIPLAQRTRLDAPGLVQIWESWEYTNFIELACSDCALSGISKKCRAVLGPVENENSHFDERMI